ncbi:MAG TPA: glutathione S-transferase family protein [Candidatus Binataceae bacterium]|nr:glutathione S-transferase family protein [Candidatus Binataceae bacterium]
MEKIKLYQWPAIPGLESASPFCMKIHWALRYKHLPFEAVTMGDRDAVVALNPRAKLPALGYGDTTIIDSSDIMRFIEERHPEPRLYPRDPALRAKAIILEDWGDESLYWHLVYERWQIEDQFEQYGAQLFPGAPQPVRRQLREGVVQGLHGQGFGRMTVEQHREKFGESLDALEAVLDGEFLCGKELSVADLGVAAEVGGLDLPLTPVASAAVRKRAKVVRWLDRVAKAVA